MKKKLLYLLSGNLSTTPRALQSIRTAQDLFEVEVVAVNRSAIWHEIDTQLAAHYRINVKWVSLTRESPIQWACGTLINKLCGLIYPFLPNVLFINAFASSKAAVQLFLSVWKMRADFVISHSSASIYPAYALAKRLKIGFAVDVEDFHPGETINTDAEREKMRRIFLLQTVLPKAQYVTYASPLIGNHTLNLLEKPLEKSFLINNSFSEYEFSLNPYNPDSKIKMVWFSQNISYKRGLELIISALNNKRNQVSLCLIGNADQAFCQEWIEPNLDFIQLVKPISQSELHQMLADFDVGLASEVAVADFNREIALTNKIFAYAQAGLYIIATDTPAQTQFIMENQSMGVLCAQTWESFSDTINNVIDHIGEIRKAKPSRFLKAKELSWEVESLKLIKAWKEL